MALNKVNYTDNETIITAENLNNIQNEVIDLESSKVNKSGDIMTGPLKMESKGNNGGYYLIGQDGSEYPALYNNSDNLWIGGKSSDLPAHTGGTYISAGYNSETSTPNKTIYIGVPDDTNTTQATYSVWHNGYINYSKLYPVGAVYETSTKTNPGTFMSGTTWTLVGKKLAYASGEAEFTRNTTNTTSATVAFMAVDNMVRFRITVYPKIDLDDNQKELLTIDLSSVGISSFSYTGYVLGHGDAAECITTGTLSYDGVLTHTDVNPITNGNNFTASDSNYLRYDFTTPVYWSYCLDSACDKFIWKRTA